MKLFISLLILQLSTWVHADATQKASPGSLPPGGALTPENGINPGKINNKTNIDPGAGVNTGEVGPNTIPNNVNQNGTVNTTPKSLDKNSEDNPDNANY